MAFKLFQEFPTASVDIFILLLLNISIIIFTVLLSHSPGDWFIEQILSVVLLLVVCLLNYIFEITHAGILIHWWLKKDAQLWCQSHRLSSGILVFLLFLGLKIKK